MCFVKKRSVLHNVPVAQLDRALVSGTKGRGFESLRARQLLIIDILVILY